MNKKLSTKEREEIVTKGFFVDYLETKEYVTESRLREILDSKNYVTEDFLVEYVHAILDSKNYITKDYLDMRFEKAQKTTHQYMQALMEHSREQTLVLIDAFQGRFERIERRLDLKPWGL